MNDDDSKSLAEAGTFGVEITFKTDNMSKDKFVKELGHFLMSIAKDVEARKGGLVGHVKAFARVDDGIEGLIHVSELSDRRINNPKEVVKEGDVLQLRVIKIDSARRRLGLSLKRMDDAEYSDYDSNGTGEWTDAEEASGESAESKPTEE